jgi:hypothetical protein
MDRVRTFDAGLSSKYKTNTDLPGGNKPCWWCKTHRNREVYHSAKECRDEVMGNSRRHAGRSNPNPNTEDGRQSGTGDYRRRKEYDDSKRTCYHCNKLGHISPNCPDKQSKTIMMVNARSGPLLTQPRREPTVADQEVDDAVDDDSVDQQKKLTLVELALYHGLAEVARNFDIAIESLTPQCGQRIDTPEELQLACQARLPSVFTQLLWNRLLAEAKARVKSGAYDRFRVGHRKDYDT